MDKKIDFTLKEILADKQIKDYLKYGEVKIRNCINSIEQKYFDDKRIYHVSSPKKKSDFLFRYEIKGLLLLLLKIELNDPFDNRAQKDGVTSLKIDRLINQLSPEEIDMLSLYEYNVLTQFCDPEYMTMIYEVLEKTKKSLFHLSVIYAKKYDSFITDLSKSILTKIEQLSEMIIGRSYGEDDLKISAILSPNKTLTKIIPSSYSSELNLKKAVVNAIKRISRDIYYFDDNKVCYRKLYLPKTNGKFTNICKRFYDLRNKQIDFANLNRLENEHKECLFKKQAYEDDINYIGDENDDIFSRYDGSDYDVSMNDEEREILNSIYRKQIEREFDEEGLSSIRNRMEEVLNNYYNESLIVKATRFQKLEFDKNVDDKVKELGMNFEAYALYLYNYQTSNFDSSSKNQNKKYCLKECYELRKQVERVTICDIEFDQHLASFERIFFNKYDWNSNKERKSIEDIIKETLNDFEKDVHSVHKDIEEEYRLIDSGQFEGTSYSVVEANIKNINDIIGKLVNEIYAMIIKLRAENKGE